MYMYPDGRETRVKVRNQEFKCSGRAEGQPKLMCMYPLVETRRACEPEEYSSVPVQPSQVLLPYPSTYLRHTGHPSSTCRSATGNGDRSAT
jgi:hypothetical protein